MAAPVKINKLTCADRKRARRTTTTTGRNPDVAAAARRDARLKAEPEAIEEALAFAATFKCPPACPIRKIVIQLDKPVLAKPKQIQFGGGMVSQHRWECEAKCKWSILIYCQESGLPTEDEAMEEQELECDAGEQAFACGVQQAAGSDRIQLKAKQMADAGARLGAYEEVAKAIAKVTCAAACPNKRITTFFGPLTDVTDPKLPQPDKDGDFYSATDMRWAVWVSCS